MSFGGFAAPVLGGVLYDKSGYGSVFGLAVGIIGIDFIMRLVLIEKKTAAKYQNSLVQGTADQCEYEARNDDAETGAANEEDTLLPKQIDETYKIKHTPNKFLQLIPILYCFRNPRLLTALTLSLIQATFFAVFDATIPTEAQTLFGFNSLEAGLLFIALEVPCLIVGPIAGWAVDKYGTKPVAVFGFTWLVPALALLRLPTEGLENGMNNVLLYSAILALNGFGLVIIGSPTFVEASEVVQNYDKANPNFFGANGPYAQLYGFSSMFYCAGMTIGPVIGGALKDSIGYGNMNAVFAALSATAAIVSFLIMGGRPKLLQRRSD